MGIHWAVGFRGFPSSVFHPELSLCNLWSDINCLSACQLKLRHFERHQWKPVWTPKRRAMNRNRECVFVLVLHNLRDSCTRHTWTQMVEKWNIQATLRRRWSYKKQKQKMAWGWPKGLPFVWLITHRLFLDFGSLLHPLAGGRALGRDRVSKYRAGRGGGNKDGK